MLQHPIEPDKKYIFPQIKRDAICLPSTSPANAAWSLNRLVEEWGSSLFSFEKENNLKK